MSEYISDATMQACALAGISIEQKEDVVWITDDSVFANEDRIMGVAPANAQAFLDDMLARTEPFPPAYIPENEE